MEGKNRTETDDFYALRWIFPGIFLALRGNSGGVAGGIRSGGVDSRSSLTARQKFRSTTTGSTGGCWSHRWLDVVKAHTVL